MEHMNQIEFETAISDNLDILGEKAGHLLGNVMSPRTFVMILLEASLLTKIRYNVYGRVMEDCLVDVIKVTSHGNMNHRERNTAMKCFMDFMRFRMKVPFYTDESTNFLYCVNDEFIQSFELLDNESIFPVVPSNFYRFFRHLFDSIGLNYL